MNTQQVVELVTDAVVDAVREALPRMVTAQLEARMAQLVTPALDKLDRALEGWDARMMERISAMQADFATRTTTQTEALPRMVGEALDARAAQIVAPALDKIDRALEGVHARVQERITDMQADFATRGIAQCDALTDSWQLQVEALRASLAPAVAEALDARVAQLVTPALDKLGRALEDVDARVQERTATLQADFAARMVKAETLAASWQCQVDGLDRSIVERVAAAVAGIPSQAGAAGPPGPPGAPGRDATMVSPVHWKADQVFQRGAVVQHRGGLWFANQDSSAEPGTGVDGYALMFDGCEIATYEYDERGYQVANYRYASGRVNKVATGFRPFRYAGVYDHGTTYHLNDAVTASGCMWMCKAIHVSGAKPGTDEAARHWQLAVKSGRDGRDGAPGPKGDPGPPGPAGPAAPRPNKGKANGVTA